MFTKEEIQSIAKEQRKPAGVIDKDYALEWLLYGIYHKDSKIKDYFVFKGGTSIRKIFFPNTWRFSEDLDFTLLSNTDPDIIRPGLQEIYGILESECGIIYEEDEINIPSSGNAVFGHIQFTGPLGMKNRIKIDASRIEKMIDTPTTQIINATYDDLSDFPVTGYTFNEVISEKIRSMMQRSKVRDYYDVWKLFQPEHNIDTKIIGHMVKKKCQINGIEYLPNKIFASERLEEMKKYWKRDLERLVVEDLPEPDSVFNEMKNILRCLPN
jgi:hypothetical protein